MLKSAMLKSPLLKSIAVATVALAIAGATFALAQQPPRERGEAARPPAMSREDANAYLEARIAALHTGLQLTPDQEKLWPAFEQAYRERAKLRMERLFAGNAPARTDDPIARLQSRADAMLRQGAAMKSLADAAAPLWQSFDDGQKRRFAVLARPRFGTMAMGERRSGERFGGDRQQGRDRFGFGQGQRGFGQGPQNFGPSGRDFGRGYGGDLRDYRRNFGGDYGRGQFRWWRGPSDNSQGAPGRRGALPNRDEDGRYSSGEEERL